MTQSIFPQSLDRFAVGRTPPDALADAVNKMQADLRGTWFKVTHHGARGDGVTDDTAAIQRAIDAAVEADGGVVFFPPGEYLVSAALDVTDGRGLVLKGSGKLTSVITSAHTGSGIVSRQPINTATNIHLTVADLGVTNTNPANTGAGFEDVGGTHLDLVRLRTHGFRYGVILDQSELVDLYLCDIQFPLVGGIWLCNKGDHTPGADQQFTNGIRIDSCQLNCTAAAGRVALIDDGGYNHRITGTNFNGWERHIRSAAGLIVEVANCGFEGALEECIVTASTTFHSGTSVGNTVVLLLTGNLFIPTATKATCQFSGGDVVAQGNLFSTATTPLQGCANLGTFTGLGNYNDNGAQPPTTDAPAQWGHMEIGRPPQAAGPVKVNRLRLLEAAARIIGGDTSLAIRNNDDTLDNLLIDDGGNATARGGLTAAEFVWATGEGAWVGFGSQNGLVWDSSFGPVLNSSGHVIVNIDADNNQTGTAFRVRHNAASGGGGPLLFEVNDSGALQVATSFQIGSGAVLVGHLTGTTTWDPPNLTTATETATTLTVTGAALGDVVGLSFSNNLQGMVLHGHVSAADTVTAVLRNGTGGSIDLASGTLRAVVWKY